MAFIVITALLLYICVLWLEDSPKIVIPALIEPVTRDSEKLWNGKALSVTDGDTLKIVPTGEVLPYTVRLYGIDAPEKKQAYGPEARASLARALGSTNDTSGAEKVITVREVSNDPFGRKICELFVDGHSVNRDMVRLGNAWWYEKYAADDTDLKQLEEQAKRHQLGLWSLPDPVAPWEWRKSH